MAACVGELERECVRLRLSRAVVRLLESGESPGRSTSFEVGDPEARGLRV